MAKSYTEGKQSASERWQRVARRQWEAVRATIPPPWCKEAVEIDLEWWRQRLTYNEASKPAPIDLAALWGCSRRTAERRVAQLVGPAAPAQAPEPDTEQLVADTLSQRDAACRSVTQPVANGTEQPGITETADAPCRSVTHAVAGCRDAPNIQPPNYIPDAPKKEEGRTYEQAPVQQSLFPAGSAAAPAPATTEKAKASKAPSEEVARVWALYRQHHPRAAEVPPKSWGVETAVAELGEQAVLDLVRWAHEAPDERAQYLREKSYLGETLFRQSKRATYAEQAAQWLSGVGVPKVRQAIDQRLPPKEQAKVRQQDEFERLAAAFASGAEPVWEFQSE